MHKNSIGCSNLLCSLLLQFYHVWDIAHDDWEIYDIVNGVAISLFGCIKAALQSSVCDEDSRTRGIAEKGTFYYLTSVEKVQFQT